MIHNLTINIAIRYNKTKVLKLGLLINSSLPCNLG